MMAKNWLNRTWLTSKLAGEGDLYAFGNTSAEDALKGLDFATADVSILMLACGDIRHILKTVSKVNDGSGIERLKFVINDMEEAVIARDLCLLFMIDQLDVDNEADVALLWAIWYNIELSADQHKRFTYLLRHLVEMDHKQTNWKYGDNKTAERCIETWKHWTEASYDRDDIIKKRNKWFSSMWQRSGQPDKIITTGEIDKDAVEKYTTSFLKVAGADPLLESWSQPFSDYFSYGKIDGSNDTSAVGVINPTLMRPGSSEWNVDTYSTPLTCYVPRRW